MSKRHNPLAKQDPEQLARSIYVRKKLIDLGISQRELAAMVPMRYQYLNHMLHGKRAGEKYWDRILEVLKNVETGKQP